STGATLIQTPLSGLICPSRRRVILYPMTAGGTGNTPNVTSGAARSDYAINSGDTAATYAVGPSSLSAGDDPAYSWSNTSTLTGISFLRSTVSVGHITDGPS